jgi:hypothetical protein
MHPSPEPIDNGTEAARRPRFLTAAEILANQADPGLADDLRELLGDETTDDMEDPWEKAARRQ